MFCRVKFLLKLSTFFLMFLARNLSEAAGSEHGFKVYNGTEVPRDNPYLKYVVKIFIQGHLCGGVVIAPKAVLTAAHCVTLEQEFSITEEFLRTTLVCAGLGREDCGEIEQKFRAVKQIILHAKYDTESIENDIAIFILKKAFDVDGITVASIRLPSRPTQVGAVCVFIGFGDTTCQLKNHSLPETAQFTNLVIVSKDYCQAILPFRLTSANICAGDPNNHTFTCKGDSGSGLFYDGTVVGVLSMGIRTLGATDVFTDVYLYQPSRLIADEFEVLQTQWQIGTVTAGVLVSLHLYAFKPKSAFLYFKKNKRVSNNQLLCNISTGTEMHV